MCEPRQCKHKHACACSFASIALVDTYMYCFLLAAYAYAYIVRVNQPLGSLTINLTSEYSNGSHMTREVIITVPQWGQSP